MRVCNNNSHVVPQFGDQGTTFEANENHIYPPPVLFYTVLSSPFCAMSGGLRCVARKCDVTN